MNHLLCFGRLFVVPGRGIILLAMLLLCDLLSAQPAVPLAASGSGSDLHSRVLHGHVPRVVSSLSPRGQVAAEKQLRLAIGLPLREPAALDAFLAQLYDPASPTAHQFLTPEEFTARFGPTEQDYQAVIDFARTNGFTIEATHGNRLLLDVAGPASAVEKAFHITLRTYRHPTEARDFYAPDTEPSVQANLPMTDVQGLSDYSKPHPKVKRRAAENAVRKSGSAPDSSGAYFGNDFRNAYVPGASLTGSGQMVGLVQFDGFYASDIAAYAAAAGNGRSSIPIKTVLLDGFSGTPTTGSTSGSIEVALDIEMAMAMAPGLSGIIVFEAGASGIPNDVLNAMAASNTVRNLSCSWGWSGGPSTTTDTIFKQMAAQGQSFFSASGDSDAFTTGATSANGVDNTSLNNTPSSSPYVTEVGGTTLTTSGSAWASETVWNWGYSSSAGAYVGSSGGISSYYAIPSWQTNITGMASRGGSATYRNIPDVALTGDDVFVYYGKGSSETLGGTSCAAPLWAGIAALANQQAVASGKSAVGFINPAVYTLASTSIYTNCFHDITTGNNVSSASPSLFYAKTGYDLCTGLGTPCGTNLLNVLAHVSGVPAIVAAGAALSSESFSPTNGAIDPNETVTVNLSLQNAGLVDTTNLVAILLASTNVVPVTGTRTYGALSAGGSAVSMPFAFMAIGSCGDAFNIQLHLVDGALDLGTVSFSMQIGKYVTITNLQQNFDGVTAPALPSGWTRASSGSVSNWLTYSNAYYSIHNSAFIAAPTNAGVSELISPAFTVVSTNAQLTFMNDYILEPTNPIYQQAYDGGLLEIQIGGGSYADILSAGGSFSSGAYNRIVYYADDNPLASREVWSGSSAGWVSVAINLPASAAGQTLHLKWRLGTDSGNGYGSTGWCIDNVLVQESYYICSSSLVAPTLLNPRVKGTNFVFSFQTALAQSYAVEYKDALTNGSWTTLQTFTGNGSFTTVTNALGDSRRFYRLRSP